MIGYARVSNDDQKMMLTRKFPALLEPDTNLQLEHNQTQKSHFILTIAGDDMSYHPLKFLVVSALLTTTCLNNVSYGQNNLRNSNRDAEQRQPKQMEQHLSKNRKSIVGGPSSFSALSGTTEEDFCCKSGSGSQGNNCGSFDPDEAICTDFVLHCSGSWSCQPNGTQCECL